MKTILFAVFTFISVTTMAQSGESYSQVMRKYLVATNTLKNMEAMVPQIFKPFQESSPNVPKEFWDSAKEEILKDVVNQMTDMLTPIYQKYLTQKELEDVLAFYESPAGKKISDVTPNITTEAIQVGQKWGVSIVSKIQAKMKEKGYTK
ncbi:DUF2059 domain-containing protein [uncultured Bacteroides sp.]|uniref:DUF2059 domain-containing protein n=1 Tax=uncultured Bacteroides sp. TaxID=162156 RepID=UPI002AA74A99|nr:DUF2059 domain-containing protein [uncultured Bacteroides sp.]